MLLSRLVEDAGFSAPDFLHVLPATRACTLPQGDALEELRLAMSNLFISIQHRPKVSQPPPVNSDLSASAFRPIPPPLEERSDDQPMEWRSSRYFKDGFDNSLHDVRKRRFSPSWWTTWLQEIACFHQTARFYHPLHDSLAEIGTEPTWQFLNSTKARIVQPASMPEEVRPAAWFWLAANGDVSKLSPALYHELCHVSLEPTDELEVTRTLRQQIAVDLERTPSNLFVSGTGLAATATAVTARVAAAERVLLAYSRHRPHIGYCQGLNFIVAVLLSLLDEASGFIVFCGLLERLPADWYCSNPERLARSRDVAQRQVIDTLVEEREKLYEHLRRLELDFNLFLPRWLTCLFAAVLPFKAIIRLWDHVLGSGGGATVTRLAIALLCRAEDKLLQTADTQEALDVLSSTTSRIGPADIDVMLCNEWPTERFKQCVSGFHNSTECEFLGGFPDRVPKSYRRPSDSEPAEDASTNASSMDRDLLLDDDTIAASALLR